MRILILILLATVLFNQTTSRCLNSRNNNNCCNCCESNNCCESDNCCESNSNCCESNNNCCDSNKDCCENKNSCKEHTNCRQSSRICSSSRLCSNSCDNNNNDRRPCDDQARCKIVATSTATPPYKIPTVQTVFRPSSSVSNSSHVTKNENIINVPTNINLSNIVQTETRVYVPINITFKSYNNVQIIPSTTQYNYTVPTNPVPPTEPQKTVVIHHNNTKVVPQPVYVPVPGRDRYVWVPYFYPGPQQQENCCNMVQPCLWNNCQSVKTLCNQGCSGGGTYYNPVNPCIGGCNRMEYWNKQVCTQSGCGNVAVDCSKCHPDCFKNFEGFSQCGGCFQSKGLPWQNGMRFG